MLVAFDEEKRENTRPCARKHYNMLFTAAFTKFAADSTKVWPFD